MESGVEVSILIGGEGYFFDHLKSNQVQVYSIPDLHRNIHPVKDYRSFRYLKEWIKKLNPDLISAHSSKIGFLGRLVSHSLGIPTIFTAHGWAFRDGVGFFQHHLFKRLENLAAQKSDKLICVSEFDRRMGLKYLNVPSDRFITIHNGMPDIVSDFHANPTGSGLVNIIKIARFDQPKDHIQLLDALKSLSGYHLHLVGDGPLMEESQEFAASKGMKDRVTFHGPREDIAELLSQAQIFTLISNLEGFPRSTLEAMRAGLPVVVSDVGGAAEAIEEGVTGYAVPKGNVDFLREKLHLLILDPQLRQRMGTAARKRYETHFTFDQMFEKTCQIYREVLSDRASWKSRVI